MFKKYDLFKKLQYFAALITWIVDLNWQRDCILYIPIFN